MAIKRGTSKKNTLNGTSGKDSLFGLGGDDTLNGKGGNDKLFGGTGNDKLFGGKGNDSLDGGTGNDLLDGGTGNDTMKGGAGDDTYIVDSAGDVVIDSSGTDIVFAAMSYTLGADIENLVLAGAGAINGTGNAGINIITGNGGANILNGGGGADTLNGGEGNDTYVIGNAGVTISDTSGIDTVQSSMTYALGTGIENLVLTGAGAINGTGNASANTIIGNAGANLLDGGMGIDTLDGGGGSDIYKFRAADIGAGETIHDTGITGSDTIYATGAASVDFSSASISGIENVYIDGPGATFVAGQLSSTANISSFDNTNETLTIFANSNFDASGWTFNFIAGFVLDQSWYSADHIIIHGTSAADSIIGTIKNDSIFGNAGADTITGGQGADDLVGGGDSDTYVFTDADVAAGESVNDSGPTGTDTLQLANSAFLVDFSAASQISGIEQLKFSDVTSNQRMMFLGSQFGLGLLTATTHVVAANPDNFIFINEASGFDASGFTYSGAGVSSLAFIIEGTSAADTIIGSAFKDFITGGAGADTLDGQDGDDSYSVLFAGDVAAGESITDTGGPGVDVLNIGVSASANIDFRGATTISGIETFSLISSATFNASQLDVNLNWDFINLPAQTVTINNASSFSGSGWTITFQGPVGSDVFNINGTAGFDFITGTSLWDVISTLTGGGSVFAGAGNDILIGGSGTDFLNGEGDNDLIFGFAGADQLFGGLGNDTYRFFTGDVVAGETISDAAVSGGFDRVEMVGNGFVNFFAATNFDFIEELAYVGGTTTQAVEMKASQAQGLTSVIGDSPQQFLTIHLGNTAGELNFDGSGMLVQSWKPAEGDTLTINGSSGNNTIRGTNARDSISSGGGIDTIRGGGEADTLSGDLGTVKFVYGLSESGIGAGNRDQILFFTQGDDRFDLRPIGGVAFTGYVGGFSGGGAHEARAFLDGLGNTIVEIDQDGNGTADQQIQINGFTGTLAGTDFLL